MGAMRHKKPLRATYLLCVIGTAKFLVRAQENYQYYNDGASDGNEYDSSEYDMGEYEDGEEADDAVYYDMNDENEQHAGDNTGDYTNYEDDAMTDFDPSGIEDDMI